MRISSAADAGVLPAAVPTRVPTAELTGVHHIELWLPDLTRAEDGLALHAGGPDQVEAVAAEAVERGWALLFADAHP